MGKIKWKNKARKPQKDLPEIVRKEGFKSIEDYIRANFHYLSPDKQALFKSITRMEKELTRGMHKNGKG